MKKLDFPELAPIILFAYNRPNHTKLTLDYLASNDLAKYSELIIFCDGAKNDILPDDFEKIADVRRLAHQEKRFLAVKVIERESNMGLAQSIIAGVSSVVNEYGRAIVIEDDLLTSKFFLRYMNEGLNRYVDEENVMQISGFCFDIGDDNDQGSFFLKFPTTWGWATWKRAWSRIDFNATGYERLKEDSTLLNKFNIDGAFPYAEMLFTQMEKKVISSWGIRNWYSIFTQSGLVLTPAYSLVKNIGFDGSGEHCGEIDVISARNWNNNYQVLKFPSLIERDDKKMQKVREELIRMNQPLSNKVKGFKLSRIKSFLKNQIFFKK